MSALLVGKCLGVETKPVTRGGKTWDETTIYVLDGMVTRYVTTGRDFDPGALPSEGQDVALKVSVRAYPKGSAAAGYAFTAYASLGEQIAKDLIKVVAAADPARTAA